MFGAADGGGQETPRGKGVGPNATLPVGQLAALEWKVIAATAPGEINRPTCASNKVVIVAQRFEGVHTAGALSKGGSKKDGAPRPAGARMKKPAGGSKKDGAPRPAGRERKSRPTPAAYCHTHAWLRVVQTCASSVDGGKVYIACKLVLRVVCRVLGVGCWVVCVGCWV